MDLVECEAPLDNSFQKDRLELVNKGSLGRRRKPSRSNLRLILSPSNDRQIIDVFHNHRQLDSSDGSFLQDKVSPAKILGDSALDNLPKSLTTGHLGKKFTSHNHHSEKKSASDNYRAVVGSIKQIYSNNCFDLNGNNQRIVSSVNNRLSFPSSKQEENSRKINETSTSESKNKVNSKYHSQCSVNRNQHNGTVCDHLDVIKLINGHLPNKFNHNGDSQKIPEYKNHYAKLSNGYPSNKLSYDDDSKNQTISEHNHYTTLNNGQLPGKTNCFEDHDVSKNQNISEYKNHLQAINNSKSQQISKTHQNVITFSNHRQIVTSVPVQTEKSILTNGSGHIASSQNYSSKSYIEPSLSRTTKELSLVEEARQFSVEAKLKRKNSDVQGRSAVLIQTWERRTQYESNSKSKKDSRTISKNRFIDKENCDTNTSAMPDSYICTKYKGSLQNGDNLEKGELVSCVRDVRPDETMVYRVAEDRHRRIHLSAPNGEVTVNGSSTVQEPEWISLSRKLCAKFVEGHIEPNSPDSYTYEEPEGVGEGLSSSPPSKKSHSGSESTIIKKETEKKKSSPIVSFEEATPNGEPPWIHLSRKLCTKFIEEHIEYPPITNGHFVEVPELIEPNGDVRIIEKIGKPKGHKSKQKKECEPEWVSLSKKLRAKFIESHIDDPDTIALDNQLNASDPEENGSETLSDISQDTAIPKEINGHLTPVEGKNYIIKDQVVSDNSDFDQNVTHLEKAKYEENVESSIFSGKECCWEYQEMEFDQESNSGNFQELECNDQPLEEIRIQRIQLPRDDSNKQEERVTFSNSFFSQNSECFNNDVTFMPRFDNNEVVPNTPEQNKLITVQFIAHTRRDEVDDNNDEARVPSNSQSSRNEPFFNFSPWEVAHFQNEEEDSLKKSEEIPIYKDFRSKSLDNLCDSLEESYILRDKKRASLCSADNFDSGERFLSVPKKLANNEVNENFVNEMKMAHGMSCDISFTNANNISHCTCESKISKSEENVASSSNLFSERNFNNKTAIDSSSEDEVFECDPRIGEQPWNSFEINPSGKAFSVKNLKKKIKSNQSMTNSSPESLNEELRLNQSGEISSPESLRKGMQFNQSGDMSSPESLKKGMKFNQSREMSSPGSLRKGMQCNQSREMPSPESPRKGMQFNQSREISSPESLRKGMQFNQSREMSSPESPRKGMQFNQSKNVSSRENLKEEVQFNQYKNMPFSDNQKKESQSKQAKNNKEKTKSSHRSEDDKDEKCNGMIPNSIYNSFTDNKKTSSNHTENKNNVKYNSKEPVKIGMSKWITMSKSEQNISKPEYSNIQPFIHEETKTSVKSPEFDTESKDKRKKNKIRNTNGKESEKTVISNVKASPIIHQSNNENKLFNNMHSIDENMDKLNTSPKNSDLKSKCKSLCDISRISNTEENKLRQHESIADLCSSSSTQTSNPHHPEIEFQHFENDSEIPLCAKLVSNHDKKISRSIASMTPSNRTESPCQSESSHVYEDMFKETPSGPSDSEASWTVLKHNTYYVNGRSSSMNDLDFSDSCSMSVKCDYASSSESSTLQSRHSSYASSSFYVNLRDYDSHMLEPNFCKNKKSYDITSSNGKTPNATKSNPPTPESLRHLFTSPLTSIHALPNRSTGMLNRIPSDPQSHYYSTAAAASSAFKHGFSQVPAKPKKTERSSSIKIKDIAHGIMLTFKKFQNHSKNSSLTSNQHVDVSHLAELKSNSEFGKTNKGQKNSKNKNDKSYTRENGKSEFDSSFLSDVQRAKARRSSSDLTDWKSNSELFHNDKKKSKKKGSKDKGKKNKSKDFEPRTVPTVSRKVQQMADGTLYLVTTVSGDSTMPGVYSDSPDTSSELSGHRSVKTSGESNC